MASTPRAKRLRGDSLGLTFIVASLAVIVLIVALLLDYRRDQRVTQIRAQGISLARVLSEMPVGQLVPSVGARGPLSVLQHRKADSDFAYAQIADVSGQPLAQVAAPGVVVPEVPMGRDPSSWLRDRRLTLGANQRDVVEFRAPILKEGEPTAEVRIAFYEPQLLPGYGELPFLATLALPIFLLVPLFYWLLKREIKPLASVGEQLEEAVTNKGFRSVSIEPTGPLADFMERFNRFSVAAEDRIKELESGRNELITSAKLISYNKSRVETVLRAFPEGVLILDDRGRVKFANEKVAALLGMSHEALLQTPVNQWQTFPEVIEHIAKYASGGGGPMETMSFRTEQTNRRSLALNSYPLFAPHDTSANLGTLVVIRDATEEALAKESRAEFVAHVAHELKTPLNTLTLYSEMLMDNGEDPALRTEAINVIRDEVERIGHLIGNLLNITRIEMGSHDLTRSRIRMGDFLTDIFEHLGHNVRDKNLEFDLDLPRDLPPVRIDKDLLRVAINNLITNAIKYNKEGGRVRLSAEESDDAVLIRVQDTGVGISEEDQKKIFGRFVRGSSEEVTQRGGHGLGLSLATDIVALHDGSLEVESQLGEGSVFTIVLRKDSGLLQQAI